MRVASFVVFAALLVGSSAEARERDPSSQLAPLWARLGIARGYRADFVIPGSGTRAKSYKQLLDCYVSVTCVAGLNGQSPKQEFQDLYGDFQSYLGSALLAEEASWGAQESLNRILEGQALVGNDSLVRALRARFPGVNAGASDPLVLLEQSENEFKAGIDLAVEQLRIAPASLRAGGAGGAPNSDFPFWVENTKLQGGPQGELVENELYRFTELVYLQALAGNTRAKRKFFFENEKPAGRDEAVRLAKRAAQNIYLHAIVLTKAQPSATFQTNKGYELKRQAVDAQRLFEDILSGFNPIELRSDFVPPGEVGAQGFISNANNLVCAAVASEGAVQNASRDVDQLQTALASELASQQVQFLNEISALTAIPLQQLTPDRLIDSDKRELLLAEADDNMRAGQGGLGLALLDVEKAASAARSVKQQIDQIPVRIRLEEGTVGETNTIRSEIVKERAVAEFAAAVADSVIVCTCAAASGTNFFVGKAIAAKIRNAADLHAATQEAEISGLISAQRVKELLLEQAILLLSFEGAGLEIESRKTFLDQERARLERLIRGYVSAQANLATAYFSNPAYRLQRDSAEEEAEALFEDAMVAAYQAAKALEYEWAERLQNPVERTDGGLPQALGASYVPIIRSESAFAVRSAGVAGAPQPGLDTFMDALKQWDLRLRQTGFRSPAPGTGSVVWSLRNNILGFGSGDINFDELRFSDFVEAHRAPGANATKKDLRFDFTTQIGTNGLLPGAPLSPTSPKVPAIKITGLELNLRSRLFRNLIGSGGGLNPPIFTVDLRDSSVVRTFFAKYPDDDLLVVDLPGARSFELSPNNSPVQARVDGIPVSLSQSDGFDGLSPAVSKWVMQLDMTQLGNSDLILENLGDIEIRVNYQFGRPPTPVSVTACPGG